MMSKQGPEIWRQNNHRLEVFLTRFVFKSMCKAALIEFPFCYIETLCDLKCSSSLVDGLVYLFCGSVLDNFVVDFIA